MYMCHIVRFFVGSCYRIQIRIRIIRIRIEIKSYHELEHSRHVILHICTSLQNDYKCILSPVVSGGGGAPTRSRQKAMKPENCAY